MRILLLTSFLVTFASCKPKTTWQTMDFGVFKLKAPRDWRKVTVKGIDSYAGGLTNKNDTIWFDYGEYIVSIGDEDYSPYKLARDTINGLRAEIIVPEVKSKGVVSMFIPKVTDEYKLTMYAKDCKETETILRIFKSTVFKISDTLVNPPLTENKFSEKYYPGDKLYKINCASCHRISGDLVGPALKEVFGHRSKEWVYQFLTGKNEVGEDSISKAYKLKFESKCMTFPRFTQGDVNSIYHYAW